MRQDIGMSSRSNNLLSERSIRKQCCSLGRDEVPDRSVVGAAESDRQFAKVVFFPLLERESVSR